MVNVHLRDKSKLRDRDHILGLFANCIREDLSVFRIEHDQDKHGPYVTEDYTQWRDTYHNVGNGRPLSSHDPAFQICLYDESKGLYPDHEDINYYSSLFEQLSLISREENDYILFAFESMDQLKSWFSETELTKILNMGYSIKEYKVKRAIISSHQAIFFSSDSSWTR